MHSFVVELGGNQNVWQTYLTEIIPAYFSVVLVKLENIFRWWITDTDSPPPHINDCVRLSL